MRTGTGRGPGPRQWRTYPGQCGARPKADGAAGRMGRVYSEIDKEFAIHTALTEEFGNALDVLDLGRWLRDERMEDTASLPPPDEIAPELVEDLRATLEQLEEIDEDLTNEPIAGRHFGEQE